MLGAFFLFTLWFPAGAKIAALGSLGAPSTIVAVLVLGWWVWHQFHQNEPGQQQPQLVRRAAVAFVVVAVVVQRHAVMQPMVPDEVTPSDSALVRLLALSGIVLVASDGISDTARLEVLLRRMSLAVGLVAVLGLVQFITGALWINWLAVPGLTPPVTESLVQRGRFLRPSGTSTHPIEFGAVLGMMLPLAVTHARMARSRKTLAWLWVAVIGATVLVCLSRTAIICSAVAMLILLPTWPARSRWIGLAGTVVALGAASLVFPGLLGTLRGLFVTGADDPSVESRTAGYAYAQLLFSHNPWLGRGIGTFLPKYYIFDNGYLGLLMEAGLVGLAALAGLLICALAAAFLAGRLFVRFEERQMSWALMAGVVAGSVSLAFFDLFAFPQAAACLALVVGLSGAVHRLAREPSTGRSDESWSREDRLTFSSSPSG